MGSQAATVLDAEEGLKRLGGNKKLYCKLLNSFLSQPTYGELRSFVESGDLEKARASAHALKGMAANLSLKALYEAVAALEAILKQGEAGQNQLAVVDQANEVTASAIKGYVAAV